jgi:hypothetical protein
VLSALSSHATSLQSHSASQGRNTTIFLAVLRKPEAISAAKTARPRKPTFKEQHELEGMEAAILAAETRVQELKTTWNNPESRAGAPEHRGACRRRQGEAESDRLSLCGATCSEERIG